MPSEATAADVTTAPSADLIALPFTLHHRVNAAIDRARELAGVRTDAELARRYRIHPKHISYWRNVKGTDLDTALAGILLGVLPPDVTP